jgi:hypothetical protein
MNQKRLILGLGLPSDLEFVSPELFAYLQVENRSRSLRPKASGLPPFTYPYKTDA